MGVNGAIFATLLAACFLSGCASTEVSNAQGASSARSNDRGYITGSRLPQRASQNTQGTRSVSPEDWKRYEPPISGHKVE